MRDADATRPNQTREIQVSTKTRSESSERHNHRYRDLPIPPEWQATLDGLKPQPKALPIRKLIGLTEAWSAASLVLAQREMAVLWNRSVKAQKLDEIGERLNVTSERVRQIEQHARRKIRRDPQHAERIEALLAQAEQEVPTIFDCGDNSAGMLQLLAEFQTGEKRRVCQLPQDQEARQLAVAFPLGWPRNEEIERAMRELGNFAWSDELAQRLELPIEHLPYLPLSHPSLRPSSDGRSWSCKEINLGQALRAAAKVLSRDGFKEWHASQVVKAAGVLQPKCLDVSRSAHSSMFAGANMQHFEHAGRSGIWRLRVDGDGHRSNREALREALASEPRAMHWKEVRQKLRREIKDVTLLASLHNNPEFITHGEGYYSLADMEYPAAEAEERFMLELFEQAGCDELGEGRVAEACQSQGCELEKLKAASCRSKVFGRRWSGLRGNIYFRHSR